MAEICICIGSSLDEEIEQDAALIKQPTSLTEPPTADARSEPPHLADLGR